MLVYTGLPVCVQCQCIYSPGEFLFMNCDAWLDVCKGLSNTQQNSYSRAVGRVCMKRQVKTIDSRVTLLSMLRPILVLDYHSS